jgi:hypothetical protein
MKLKNAALFLTRFTTVTVECHVSFDSRSKEEEATVQASHRHRTQRSRVGNSQPTAPYVPPVILSETHIPAFIITNELIFQEFLFYVKCEKGKVVPVLNI